MQIEGVDALSGLRAALEAPAGERAEVFRRAVMEPLRPFWEPLLAFTPPSGQQPQGDPALAAAHFAGYYSPDLGAERGLAALEAMERAGTWPNCLRAVEEAAAVLAPEQHGLAMLPTKFAVVLADPDRPGFLDRNYGYTGMGAWPGTIMVMAWPTDYNLPRLPAAAAHELHHSVRLRYEPWSEATTVGQYLVLEGLAEAFAAERYGEELVGPWAKALSQAELAATKPRLRDALEVTGFNEIRGYIFGDWASAQFGYAPRGLPDFAGYTVGYNLVRAYLARTGRSAAEATYVPWREIVQEAAYF